MEKIIKSCLAEVYSSIKNKNTHLYEVLLDEEERTVLLQVLEYAKNHSEEIKKSLAQNS